MTHVQRARRLFTLVVVLLTSGAVCAPADAVTGGDADDSHPYVAGVIWPAMVISPKDPKKQVVVATLSPKKNEEDDYLHVSMTDLGHDGAWDPLQELETAKSSGG